MQLEDYAHLLDEYASTPRFEQKVINVINRNKQALGQ